MEKSETPKKNVKLEGKQYNWRANLGTIFHQCQQSVYKVHTKKK